MAKHSDFFTLITLPYCHSLLGPVFFRTALYSLRLHEALQDVLSTEGTTACSTISSLRLHEAPRDMLPTEGTTAWRALCSLRLYEDKVLKVAFSIDELNFLLLNTFAVMLFE